MPLPYAICREISASVRCFRVMALVGHELTQIPQP